MNKKALQTWVAALRSGKYNQCQRNLRRRFKDNKTFYCCLGVCDLVLNCSAYDGNYGSIYDKLGFSLEQQQEYGTVLIRMNDYDNKNFNEIADYIEAELLPLAV